METKVRCPKCGTGFGFQKPPAEAVPGSPDRSAEQWESECERMSQALTLLIWHHRMTTAPIAVAEMATNLPNDPDLSSGGLMARCMRPDPPLPYSAETLNLLRELHKGLDHLTPDRLVLLKASIRGVLRGWSMGARAGGDT